MESKLSEEPLPLMDHLRLASRSAHRTSRTTALAATAATAASPTVYRGATVAFATVYAELEATIEAVRLDHPRLGALHCPTLYRAAALAEDVAFHHGGDSAAAAAALAAPPTPAVATYVAHIRSLAGGPSPITLVGLASAMHIAPAAGGSVLSRLLRWTLRLGRGSGGLSVFDYPGVDVAAVRRRYKEGLNALALSRAERDAVAAQRVRVFALNDAVFVEVAAAAARGGVATAGQGVVAVGRGVAVAAVLVGGAWAAREVLLGSVGVLLGWA